MSDDRSQSEFDDPDFDELAKIEASLEKMRPMPMKADFMAELERDIQNVVATKKTESSPIFFTRFVPLAVAACLVLSGFIALKMGAFSEKIVTPDPVVAIGNISEEDAELIHGLPQLSPSERFQPMSRQQYMRNASVGGYVDDGNGGYAREVKVEILEDKYFYDEETQTNWHQLQTHYRVVLEPVRPD